MPSEGERFYLRVLVLNRRGPISYNDLKTIVSIWYDTFREAAQQMGLLKKDNLIIETMREACESRMPAAVQKLFVTVSIYCNLLEVRKIWDEFHTYMLEDYPLSSSSNPSIRRLLTEIDLSLIEFGKGIKDFDLPTTSDYPPEGIQINHLIRDERSIPISTEDLQAVEKLNNGQKQVFDTIMEAVRHQKSSLFFIDGPAGTGKTFLYRALLAAIRNEGHIALAIASSGIAAIMMSRGRTAHSRFKIPIPTLPTSTCRVSRQSDLGDLLCEASVIIWDEASMAHRNTFEVVDRTLQDLLHCDLPFGSKVVILGGDFRQVLPVVTHGSRYQTVNACVTYSPIWDYVQVLPLTENMLAKSDPFNVEMLLKIGDYSQESIGDNMIKVPSDMIIPWEGEQSISHLINQFS